MIESKADYRRYLEADRKAAGAFTRRPILSDNAMIWLTDPCWQFTRLLRRLEYRTNCRPGRSRFSPDRLYLYALRKHFQRRSVALGLTIPPNVFGEGLCIVHYGSIVVSRHARIGKNCTIHSAVNIGGTSDRRAATIGDNCFLGPGVKIISDVVIGDNTKIGANAVVNRDFPEGNQTLVGVPARPVPSREPGVSPS